MRPRSPADTTSESHHASPTTDSPVPRLEHGDELDDRLQGSEVKAQGRAYIENHKDHGTVFSQPAMAERTGADNPATPTPTAHMSNEQAGPALGSSEKDPSCSTVAEVQHRAWSKRLRNPWACSPYSLITTLLGLAVVALMAQSFLTKQLDVKGCEMAYMRPMYERYRNFDTEHTRFASKYSLYLYREGGIDEDTRVGLSPP